MQICKTKLVFLIYSFLGVALHCHSQKYYDYNWAFGYGNDNIDTINYPDFGGLIMSFKDKKVNFHRRVLKYDFQYQSNSFSNTLGNLELLSNGCAILNDSGNVVSKGDSLSYGSLWFTCPKEDPQNQNAVFIKLFSNDSLIIFLHFLRDTFNVKGVYYRKALLETKIDLINNCVIEKNKKLLVDTFLYEGFTCISALDPNEYWLILPQFNNNKYKIAKYDINGIKDIQEFSIGVKNDSASSFLGQGFFSPNGKYYALYNSAIGLQIFDFDRTNGSLSNYKYYGHKHEQLMFAGVCFSPDSKLLYFNTSVHMFQLELATGIIDTIASYEPYNDPYPTTFMHSALGPDCRIYTCTPGGNRYLHVILYPNRKGKACGFIQRGVKLPTRNGNAIPNFPHYRVNEPYPCDSTIALQLNTGVDGMDVENSGILFLYPNPVTEEMTIELRDKNQSIQQVNIYTSSGILCASQVYFSSTYSERISLHSLSPGIYILECNDRSGLKYRHKFVKI